jgi:hypothetical protein
MKNNEVISGIIRILAKQVVAEFFWRKSKGNASNRETSRRCDRA